MLTQKGRKTIWKYGKTIGLLLLMLIGYRVMGQVLLRIHWGRNALGEMGSFFLSMGRKLLQLVYVLLIFRSCGWMNRLKFNRRKFLRGLKMAYPFLILYGILLGLAILQQMDLLKVTGSGNTVTLEFVLEKFLYFFGGVAVTEELFFRGLVMKQLSFLNTMGTRHWNRSLFLQALLFGAMHGWQLMAAGQYATAMKNMVWAALGGLLYGWIYEKSKSIWSVVALHGFYDFAVTLLFY